LVPGVPSNSTTQMATTGASRSYESPATSPPAAATPATASSARAIGRWNKSRSSVASTAAVTPKTMLGQMPVAHASTDSASHVRRARPTAGTASTSSSGASR